FLDLEFTLGENGSSPAALNGLAGVERLQRFTSGPFGVKLGRDSRSLVQALLADLPARLTWVLLAGGAPFELVAWVGEFRGRGGGGGPRRAVAAGPGIVPAGLGPRPAIRFRRQPDGLPR